MNIAEAVGVRRVVIVGGLVGFVGMSLSSLAVSIEYIIIMFGLFFGKLDHIIFIHCKVYDELCKI